MERLRINEFDFMGIFLLDEVQGIEDLVTHVEGSTYLSRNADYYKRITYSEHSAKREELKKRLTVLIDKKNFIILETMLNSSAKVFFEEFQKKIMKPNENNQLVKAQKCLEEDVANIINCFENKPITKPQFVLPVGDNNVAGRPIEMDNKALLYIYAKTLSIASKRHVLTPRVGFCVYWTLS